MPLRDADVLLGKLALGREYLRRADALRVARELEAGAGGSFGAAAARLGVLDPPRIAELEGVLATGALVCRGRCGGLVPLAGLRPAQTTACARCGGPLYVARTPASPDPRPAHAGSAPPPGSGSTSTAARQAVPRASAPATSSAAAPTPPPASAEGSAAAPSAADAPAPGPRGRGTPPSPRFDLDALDAAPTRAGPLTPPAALSGGGGEATLDLEPGDTARWRPQGPDFEPFRLAPDLQVVAPIGHGGMGVVYRGAVLPERRTVAIKVLVAPFPDVVARFDREIRVSTALDHPSIVKIFRTGVAEGGPEQGKPYYVMDYVAGRDLAGWLAERPRRPAESVRLVLALCAAVEHAHARGVIHRDIKPGNVIVRSADDQPVLLDFGLARCRAELQSLTRTGDILGTPAYMAPEQARGQGSLVGPPTDVWALGATLYHMLTDRPPFAAPSPFATIEKVVKHAPEAPRALKPELPAGLEAVVLKALEKSPVDRFHTCSELRRALGPFAAAG